MTMPVVKMGKLSVSIRRGESAVSGVINEGGEMKTESQPWNLDDNCW